MPNYLDREKQRLQQEHGQQMITRFNQAFVNPLAQYAQAAAAGGLDLRQPAQRQLLTQIQATQDRINDWLTANMTQALPPEEQIRTLYAQLLTIPAGTGKHPVGLPHLLQALGTIQEDTALENFFTQSSLWQKVLQERWADIHQRQQYTTTHTIKLPDRVATITIATPSGQPNNFADAATTVSVDPFSDWNPSDPDVIAQRRLDFLTALATTPPAPINFP